MHNLATIQRLACRELAAHLKSRWILITGGVCALLAWTVAFHGFAFAGGRTGPETVLVSLVHLQLYIVPLLGLLLAYDAILGERESGMFDLHLALGASPWSFLAGKWIGLLGSLWIALSPGFIVQAFGLTAVGGDYGQLAYLLFYSALLSSAVVATGLWISSLSLNRGTVISLCIGVWLLEAVLLDFVVIGLLTATDGDLPAAVVNALIAAHPPGAYRLLSYLTFFPEQTTALLHAQGTGRLAAYSLLLAWTAVPLGLAAYGLNRTFKPIHLESSHGA